MSSESQEVHGLTSSRARDAGALAGEGAAPGRRPGARPLDRVRSVYQAHPLLVTWLVLTVGMVAILLWASRDTDLLAHQRLFLVFATVGLAGLCAWIIGWEE